MWECALVGEVVVLGESSARGALSGEGDEWLPESIVALELQVAESGCSDYGVEGLLRFG